MFPLFKLDRAMIEALIAKAEAFAPGDEALGFSMALRVRHEHINQLESALIERGYSYDILDARRRPWTVIAVYRHEGISPAAAHAVVKAVLEYAEALRECNDSEVQANAHNLIRYFADQEVYRETRNQRAVFFGGIDDRGWANTYLVTPNGKVEVVTRSSGDLGDVGEYLIEEVIFVNGCFVASRETSGYISERGTHSKEVFLRMGEESLAHALWHEKARHGEVVEWEHPTGATFKCPPYEDEGVVINEVDDDGETVASEFVTVTSFEEWWEQNKD